MMKNDFRSIVGNVDNRIINDIFLDRQKIQRRHLVQRICLLIFDGGKQRDIDSYFWM